MYERNFEIQIQIQIEIQRDILVIDDSVHEKIKGFQYIAVLVTVIYATPKTYCFSSALPDTFFFPVTEHTCFQLKTKLVSDTLV